ncbi:MAG: DUF1517 domain-containing protein [Cyanobacteria bacterium J06623_7]
MSQFNIAYFNFFSAALLTTVATQGLNPAKIEATLPRAIDHTVNSSSPRTILAISQDERRGNHHPLKLAQAEDIQADEPDSSEEIAEEEAAKLRLPRLISLTYFLLFFVPLGIFYPLFLFYRMLLVKPDETKNPNGVNDILSRQETDSSEEQDLDRSARQMDQELDLATVSKLQIAFSPSASQLREELGQVGFDLNVDAEYDLVNLMHQTVAVLIEQDCWTHVSYDSITLPLAKVRWQFDAISQAERKKVSQPQTNFGNYTGNVTERQKYCYVVVTLILCTSHAKPLFQTINTKKQLLEELIQLGKMEKDTVIKFELLWNPQQSEEYISNDRLLVEYGDMVRLF